MRMYKKNYFDTLINFFRKTEFNSWAKLLPSSGLHPEEEYCINKYIRNRRLSLVDMGTGGGRIALSLSKMGFTPVYGFDIVPEFIDAARINAKECGLDIKLEIGNALDIQLNDCTVQLVIFWEKLLSFLLKPEDRQKAISEGFRVLSPGGFLFASYNLFTSRKLNFFIKLYIKLIRFAIREDLPERSLPILKRNRKYSLKSLLPGSPQAYWHFADEAVLELTNVGFHIIEIFSSSGFRQNKKNSYKNLRKGTLYIVAQKPE